MKKYIFILLILIIILAIGFALFYLLKGRNQNDTLVLYGNVDVRQVDIGFRIAGQVEELLVEEGDLVRKGDLISKLNITPYLSQTQEAKAKLKAITANLENAEIQLKRRQELIGSGGVSKETLDDTLANRNALLADFASTKAALAVSLENLSYTEVFAPNDGIVLTRIREPGTVVNPSDPVCTLSLISPIWVRAFVDEPDLGKIEYGMTAEILTDTKTAPTYSGKIGFISPVAEFTPKTVQTTQLRTDLVYRLRLYIDNPDHFLKQGMPVTVKIPISKQTSEQ